MGGAFIDFYLVFPLCLGILMINGYRKFENEVPMAATNTLGDNEIEPTLGTEPLWTVDEVSSYLRLKPETVRVMARRGELPCIKVGKRVWRFKLSEIKDWLKLQHEAVDVDLDSSASPVD